MKLLEKKLGHKFSKNSNKADVAAQKRLVPYCSLRLMGQNLQRISLNTSIFWQAHGGHAAGTSCILFEPHAYPGSCSAEKANGWIFQRNVKHSWMIASIIASHNLEQAHVIL